jgi:hypothetical protein
MEYCTIEDVKKRLKIEASNIQRDEEITGVIDEAEEMVNDVLNLYIATPLASVPKTIRYATADLAAHLFIARTPAKSNWGQQEDKRFFTLYQEKMSRYVETTFKRGKIV